METISAEEQASRERLAAHINSGKRLILTTVNTFAVGDRIEGFNEHHQPVSQPATIVRECSFDEWQANAPSQHYPCPDTNWANLRFYEIALD